MSSKGPAKWPLLLLFAGGRHRKYNDPIFGRTRMMKLVFLLQQRYPKLVVPTYEFEAYKYGPYSQDLFDDLLDMVDKNLIAVAEAPYGLQYSLRPEGIAETQELWNMESPEVIRAVIETKLRFNYMPLESLLDFVYETYPEMANASEREMPTPY